jgi:hypothetical protein
MLTRLVVVRKPDEIKAEMTTKASRIAHGPKTDQWLLTTPNQSVGRVSASLAAVTRSPPLPKL